MNPIKRRKIKDFIKKNKKTLIGVGSFLAVGLTAMLIGFEIQQKGHAIRNWLASPYATTFFIVLILGALILILLIVLFVNLARGDE